MRGPQGRNAAAIAPALRIAGYAALLDRPDAARDIIARGAFTRTLRERRDPLPLLWQHRADQQIGSVVFAEEDGRGLRIIAEIARGDCRAAAALRARSVSGMSFGYRARLYHHTQAGRVLEDIELLEVSLVTHPLQHGARVHLVR